MNNLPKKRGRKPKPKTIELLDVNNSLVPNNTTSGIIIVDDEIPIVPKKRGRKPKPKDLNSISTTDKKNNNDKKEASIVINKFTDDGKQSDTITIENNIVHLQIQCDKVDNKE